MVLSGNIGCYHNNDACSCSRKSCRTTKKNTCIPPSILHSSHDINYTFWIAVNVMCTAIYAIIPGECSTVRNSHKNLSFIPRRLCLIPVKLALPTLQYADCLSDSTTGECKQSSVRVHFFCEWTQDMAKRMSENKTLFLAFD